MFYVNEKDGPLDSRLASSLNHRYFVFDCDKEDYMLQWSLGWERVTTSAYTMNIGGKKFVIPSGMYILCGCEGGSQDWVLVDEIIDRPIDVFLIGKNFRGWSLSGAVTTEVNERSFFIPMNLKTPFPIIDPTGEKIVVVSQCDMYHKLKDRDYDIFFI